MDCSVGFVAGGCTITGPDEIYFGVDHLLTPGSHFTGQLDEVRLWDDALLSSQYCAARKCLLPDTSSHFVGYYSMDQGVAGDPAFPANDNTSITVIEDMLGTGSTDALLQNFGLLGSTSNFICSTSPLIYPKDYSISIQHYTRSAEINEICKGEPVHICLLDTSGNVIPLDPLVSTSWEYDRGAGWEDLTLPSFSGTCFGVSPGEIQVDCGINSLGYETWLIRARQVIKDAQDDSCVYYTPIDTLRICCDVDSVTLDISSNYTDNLFCEGDVISFNVVIQSPYPFLSTASAGTTIDYTYIENGVRFPVPPVRNSRSFAYAHGPAVTVGSVCWEAIITNCDSNKVQVLQQCFPVDPPPVCDSIGIMEVVGTLTEIQSSPLVYEACSGSAAKLLMTGAFLDCIPGWEYSFDPSFSTTFPLGVTNTQINTNIVPTSQWPPGATRIYYRAHCSPLRSPSGCDTCYSNMIGLEIIDRIGPLGIVGPDTICAGDSALWSLTSVDTSLQYEWICDGISVSTDTSIWVSDPSCCYVRATDSCSVMETPQQCLTWCQPIARLSCPLSPNLCPAVGDTISLTACSSDSNCGMLSYDFSWDSGTLVSTVDCDIMHVPDSLGTTYKVKVTDPYGCMDSTSITIDPCR